MSDSIASGSDPDTNQTYASFDYRFALSALYLWLLFGYLSSMVSCDLQRLMNNSTIFRHFVGIISFQLLFTTLDSENQDDIFRTATKTLAVYIIFILLTKSKWYFSIPILCMIVLDQSIAYQGKYLRKKGDETQANTIDSVREVMGVGLIALIVVGFVHYGFRQYNEFGSAFSFTTLLFSHKCGN